jgi:hypothetical protein
MHGLQIAIWYTIFFIKLVVKKLSNLNKCISFAWLEYRNLDGEVFL